MICVRNTASVAHETTQALTERGNEGCPPLERCAVEGADHRHRRLLRARGDRPRQCRTTNQRDKLAPSHSITSSALTKRAGGTASPRAFAVCRLTIIKYLTGSWTGSSDALSPRRMRSAYRAARWNISPKSAPYEIRPPSLALSGK